jgi:UDP:flavonoid glycosyltransferase YjiC (YdhE family)
MRARCIVITAMGTRGDVQPFVALGLHLRARGWRVVLASPPEFRAFTTSYGLEHEDIGISLQVSTTCRWQRAINWTSRGQGRDLMR